MLSYYTLDVDDVELMGSLGVSPMVPFLAERLKRTQVVGDLQKEAIATWRCHGIEFYPIQLT